MTILGLSSAAAPDAALEELVEIAGRRGFGAIELRKGDAHGVTPADEATWIATGPAPAAGIRITGYRTAGAGHERALARLSRALGAPVIVDGSDGMVERVDRARRLAAAGADVAVVLRGEQAGDDAALAAWAGLALAWDADPRDGSLGERVGSLLRRHAGRLRHIRLLGGGPEAALQDGAGLGEMMRCLALEGYAGTLVLAPSTTRYRVAWRNWLGRRGGWGCGSGSGTADLPLVDLAGTTSEGGS